MLGKWWTVRACARFMEKPALRSDNGEQTDKSPNATLNHVGLRYLACVGSFNLSMSRCTVDHNAKVTAVFQRKMDFCSLPMSHRTKKEQIKIRLSSHRSRTIFPFPFILMLKFNVHAVCARSFGFCRFMPVSYKLCSTTWLILFPVYAWAVHAVCSQLDTIQLRTRVEMVYSIWAVLCGNYYYEYHVRQ